MIVNFKLPSRSFNDIRDINANRFFWVQRDLIKHLFKQSQMRRYAYMMHRPFRSGSRVFQILWEDHKKFNIFLKCSHYWDILLVYQNLVLPTEVVMN